MVLTKHPLTSVLEINTCNNKALRANVQRWFVHRNKYHQCCHYCWSNVSLCLTIGDYINFGDRIPAFNQARGCHPVERTVRCRYNAVNFISNPQNRHPIARPWGRVIGGGGGGGAGWGGVCCEFEVRFTFYRCHHCVGGNTMINWTAL